MTALIVIALMLVAMVVAVSLVSLASKDRNVSPEQQRLDDEDQMRAITKG